MNLQEMIKRKRLTNYKVAKQAEIGQATISELVSGKRKEPRYSTAKKIAKVLGVEVEEIYKAVQEE
ncbi:helix-turn-helix family protein [Clostridium argentinense CDC 2741]|uniref:Helix-turn-helix family protein n=1 Tax=Clostridium argentinense CDC 2741 TaxID=1418104 RepID=A0A0C1R8U6_9CLOT|nr:helix-turn-helix transcriptional regulator [Clostridium argentinense]ARC85670.1 transcriptional regulator [Clostridium argentinense]KIE46926.1 helix-turn-helix family protein [Clostridium argentinense CDC 2741]NFF40807.1 helix-turn-helix transcriptional regulator [Clostridium argentinense]NFP50739.1 helix-turn-helix transcriptional regulator [Clostridium argentinense]NFP73104.1 helix-turn-helix transcriptional regulator [Clostridium argentinense]